MRSLALVAALVCAVALTSCIQQANGEFGACYKAWSKNSTDDKIGHFLMEDSLGKSMNDLGKFDQCRDIAPGFARYCLLHMQPLGLATYMGTCIPGECDENDMAQLYDLFLEVELSTLKHNSTLFKYLYTLNQTMTKYKSQLSYKCHVDNGFSDIKHSAGAVIVFIICLLLVICAAIGTFLDAQENNFWPEKKSGEEIPEVYVPKPGQIQADGKDITQYYIQQDERQALLRNQVGADEVAQPLLADAKQRESFQRDVGHAGSHPPRPERAPQKSMLVVFFLSFSVVRNYQALVAPSPGPTLKFLNGVRAISIMWVMLGHSGDYMNYMGVYNYYHVALVEVMKISTQAIPSAEFSVDTFFWLSGFLLAHLTLRELKKTGKPPGEQIRGFPWLLYYFHRIWRLGPPYIFVLFFYRNLSTYLSDGPMWWKYQNQVNDTCGTYWWTNLLYVNNLVPETWANQCFLWGWYLAVDMQLYIIAPIILLSYIYNKTIGWVLITLGFLMTIVINGVYAWNHDFLWNAANSDSTYMDKVYGKPYTRAAPWLLGFAVAFLYNEKRRFSASPMAVYVAWFFAAGLMATCVYVPASEYVGEPNLLIVFKPPYRPPMQWGRITNWFFFTFSKAAWSVGVAILMYTFCLGYGGFVRRFLGADFWTPLARLTYSTYLVHPVVMFVIYYSNQFFYVYNPYNLSMFYAGLLVLSFGIGAVVFLLLERPSVNLEKLLIPHKKR